MKPQDAWAALVCGAVAGVCAYFAAREIQQVYDAHVLVDEIEEMLREEAR